MPTHVLDRLGGTAPLPAKPLRVRVTTSGTQPLELALVTRDGASLQPGSCLPGGQPGVVIIPRIGPEPVQLRVRRAGAGPFPSDTVLTVTITAESRAEVDPAAVVLTGVDISGLEAADLVELSAGAQGITATALTADASPLPGLAGAAANTVRALIRAGRLSSTGLDLEVLVDASASMLAWSRDGSIDAVISVLAGMDHLLGQMDGLDVRLATAQSPWRTVAAADAGTLTTQELERLAPQSGFRPAQFLPHADRRRIVVTDARPWGQPAEASVVVVLAFADAAHTLRLDRPDIVPVLVDGLSIPEQLTSDPDALPRLVTSVLAALGLLVHEGTTP